ncbi:MAG TPA: nucleolar RNA-binding Nop10p family protein [Candidatus Nanoarchaeia archaeon]|nr:nucleolar RNA-binding Nop10p family protein [Candidatus Nanoarchaeia archaeon]
MKTEILRCPACQNYTVQSACPKCKESCISTKPAKFSIEDKWGKYRRIAKEQSKDL